MTILATLRNGRTAHCGSDCWNATDPRCSCICAGVAHGVGPDRAVTLLAGIDPGALRVTLDAVLLVVAPELPLMPAPSGSGGRCGALEVEVGPEPVPVVVAPAVARVATDEGCSGCGRPWGEVVLAAMVDAGFLCYECYDGLLREARRPA